MEKYYYKIEKLNKNIYTEIYIHKIGLFRYNWHKEIELTLVIKGVVEAFVDGKSYLLYEDDFVLINSNDGHATLEKSQDTIALVLRIDPVYFEEYLDDYSSYIFGGVIEDSKKHNYNSVRLRSLLSELIELCDKSDISSRINAEGYVAMIAALIVKMFKPKKIESESLVRRRKQKEALKKTLEYIDKKYSEKLLIEDIANKAGYNRNYMSQYFKANMGISFQTYLNRIRLREATFELSNSEENISEIALKHGFPDVKAFNGSFKKSFGKTPSQYRKEILQKYLKKSHKLEREFVEKGNKEVAEKLKELRLDFRADKILDIKQENSELKKMNEEFSRMKSDLEGIEMLLEESAEKIKSLKNKFE
jgi:AraC-like DNA-binding protein